MSAAHPTAVRLLAAFALATLASPAFADPLAADSKVDAVTVYPDRAVVTRETKITVPAGESEIVFKGLPPGFLEDSLQVAGAGLKATILDVTARTLAEKAALQSERLREIEAKGKAFEAQVKGLERELRDHQRAIRTHEEDKQVIQKQQELVDRIEKECLETKPPAPQGKDGAPVPFAKPKVEDFKELLAFSGAKAGEFKAQLRQHDEAIEGIREKMEEVNLKLADSRQQLSLTKAQGAPESRHSRVVSVRVDAAKAGELTLRLSYAVPGASWSPSYDVRLADRLAAVTYFGNVRQTTGEDWNNAALTLSTAKPDQGGRAPGLSPWTLDVRTAVPASAPSAYGGSLSYHKAPAKLESGNRQAAAQAQALNFNGLAAAEAINPVAELRLDESKATLAAAEVAAEGTHASFKIDHRATIPSSQQSFRVSITQTDLAGKLQYQGTPALNENAYLTGYFKLSGDFPFLAGPTRIFLGDTFVANDRIPTTMPGGVLMTSFGADDGIGLKRKLMDKKTEVTGFTSGGKRTTYTYEFTVENHKKTAERVVFRDHLPVSRNEKIEVSLLAPAKSACGKKPLTVAEALALKQEVTLEDDGELCWRIDLKPGEKRVIPFRFCVDHPAGLAVDGL